MTPVDIAARTAAIEEAIADPPNIHAGSPTGVWGTDRAAYELMAQRLPAAPCATLETGLGISTILFARWGCEHTCVVHNPDEVTRFREHCDSRKVGLDGVTIHEGSSEDMLPSLSLPPLDLVLIDGGHGFPIPTIDWFYGCRTLKVGGVVVVDDTQLPAVSRHLVAYLDVDPTWATVGSGSKWVAYERLTDDALGGEWTTQDFLGRPDVPATTAAKVAVARTLKRLPGGSAVLSKVKGRRS